MQGKYIMALDQGTTSSRCIIFDKNLTVVSKSQKEFKQYYPKQGYVEHDPMEIWGSQIGVATEALLKAFIEPSEIAAVGITNQRETTIIWDKETGVPVYNAIVWQCRRTAALCTQLKNEGLNKKIKEKTGLLLDPYFSATKIKWILDNVEGARRKAEAGKLLFGTVDTWLIWHLTGGKLHLTDYTNASRTMLFNIFEKKWDQELLEIFDIPASILPKVVPSSGYLGTCAKSIFGCEIPMGGIAGDQQAALCGQGCTEEGMAKNTYGTGCFLLMNTGDKKVLSEKGLITTIGYSDEKKVQYALEGSVFVGGAVIQWLKDEMGLIKNSEETEGMARSVTDTNGVYFVPAFTGLGAPYWDPYAKGLITGLTRGAKKEHVVRAALESMAYQSMDIIKLMEEESKIEMKVLKTDGGASKNDFLMQFQADILNKRIMRAGTIESTALGAAILAGRAVGFLKSSYENPSSAKAHSCFVPKMREEKRKVLQEGWKRAVQKAVEEKQYQFHGTL